ncbi:sialate O-acetylesterase [Sphingomonas sp. CLY1604]
MTHLPFPFALGAAVLLAGAAPVPAGPPVDVYILAGQSNMSGRGALADLTQAERAVDPAILLYGNDGRWRPAREPLDDAAGQNDPVSADAKAAVGPGLFFARALPRAPGRRIALLPCAKGGSSMAQWTPAPGRDTLYGSCMQRVRQAGGRVAGLLWYQGETDAQDMAQAARWSGRMRTLIAAFRRDLRAARLPAVVVTLADRPDRNAARFPAWAAVQGQQASLDLPGVALVPAAGLPLLADGLHLDTAAQRALGRRIAAAMTRLQHRAADR